MLKDSDNFEDELLLLNALGFIRGNVNLADPLLNTYADAAGGFYSPDKQEDLADRQLLRRLWRDRTIPLCPGICPCASGQQFQPHQSGLLPQMQTGRPDMPGDECLGQRGGCSGHPALAGTKSAQSNITEINNYDSPHALWAGRSCPILHQGCHIRHHPWIGFRGIPV